MQEHTHSNTARAVVNSLIIGKLSEHAPKRFMNPVGYEDNGMSGSTRTFRFEENHDVNSDGSDEYKK